MMKGRVLQLIGKYDDAYTDLHWVTNLSRPKILQKIAQTSGGEEVGNEGSKTRKQESKRWRGP